MLVETAALLSVFDSFKNPTPLKDKCPQQIIEPRNPLTLNSDSVLHQATVSGSLRRQRRVRGTEAMCVTRGSFAEKRARAVGSGIIGYPKP